MRGIFSPPPGYSAAKLGIFAALGFALATAALVPTLNRDVGLPRESELAEARGLIAKVAQDKYGVTFQLRGRAEVFNYPSKSQGNHVVESALSAAVGKEAVLLFHPKGHTPWFSSHTCHTVWQVSIEGKAVRTFQESARSWRSDNAVGPWLLACFLLSGLYFSVLTWRVRNQRRSHFE